jgi:neutral ceramidase
MKAINDFKPIMMAFLCLTVVMSACNSNKTIKIKLKPAQKIIEASGTFQAGAAKVDITPPPGYPMAGYSLAGKLSRGWWTRLYAKSIYLEDSQGSRLVLVSCDLQGIPAGLADKVAEIVATKISSTHPDSAYIGREQIILAATHTHNGPGNFFTSPAYNAQASPLSGFDEAVFDFLANRIALSITKAIASKKPALIKKGEMELPGLSRNRSLAAFERNSSQEKDEILGHVSNPQAFFTSDLPASVPSARAFQAVDPKLTILKIEPPGGAIKAPIAVAAFFAVHPTSMGPETEVYSSDIFGVASTLVEQYLRNHFSNENCVVAFFNGAEGDISANWKTRNRQNTLRIGEGLANGIFKALALAKEPVNGEISYRYEVVGIAERRVEDLHGEAANLCFSDQRMQTAKKPYPGVATFGGAEDGRTIFYQYGFREGYRAKDCDRGHGYKLFSLDKLLDIFLPRDHDALQELVSKIFKANVQVPREIPLGVYSMGPVVFTTLPGEFSMALGKRIIETLREATNSETVLLIGLANEYLSYFTTPSEYNAQHYEGASTMYGQVAGLFVEQELARIAKFPKNTANYKLAKTYKVGPPAVSELGKISPDDTWRLEEGLENLLEEGSRVQRHFPQFFWWDKPISLADGLDTINPVVSIEQKTSQGWKPLLAPFRNFSGNEKMTVMECDTTSLNFVTVIDSVSNNLSRLRTVWMVPIKDKAQPVRFCVTTPPGKVIRSKAFKIEEVLKGNKLMLVSPPE